MEDFDAVSALQLVVQEYMEEHGGSLPRYINVSPTLYKWLGEITREEWMLRGHDPQSFPQGRVFTDFGTLRMQIDVKLSDYEIIPN
jgi:hypothetical protein